MDFKNTNRSYLMDDIITLKNILSNDDINWFLDAMDSIKDPQDRAGSNKLYIPRGELGEQVKLRVLEKINSLYPDKNIHTVNFYDIVKPYGMHSDTVKFTMQGIIPLEFIDGSAYTLIYDQTSDTNIELVPEDKPEDYKPFFNKGVRDPSTIQGWSPGYKISEEDGIKYWKKQWHYYREAYKGFSIKHSYEWKIGDIFLFHTKYLHSATCSQSRKKGIMFCLN
tara:strand:- start:383 stop:1051 length:669 start_codon:yes stop_codon:yes gene_type:complete